MDNYIKLDGITTVMSEETLQGMRAARDKEELFERTVGGVRVSEIPNNVNYKVRISMLDNYNYGTKMGDFEISNGNIPGEIYTRERAKDLIKAIQDCMAKVENKE